MTDSIGRLRARLVLERPQSVPDDMGGGAITYASAETVWADIETSAAAARSDYDDRVSSHARRVTIRAPSAVSAGWRVRWGDRTLLVAAVSDLNGTHIALSCEEEVQ